MKINLELLTNQANGLGQLLFAEYGRKDAMAATEERFEVFNVESYSDYPKGFIEAFCQGAGLSWSVRGF